MSLLPAFDDFDATATWVSSTATQPKFAFADKDFAPFDVAGGPPSAHPQPMADNDLEVLFGIKFPSPQLPEPSVFDTGLHSLSAASASAYQTALASMTGHSTPCSTSATSSTNYPDIVAVAATTALKQANSGSNALQLDMLEAFTPAGSPLASGYTSPAFEFSPTPALTMCPTVDSTPGPRSASRCSSRSSLSAQTEDVKPVISCAPSVISAPLEIKPNVDADGKIKKLHLCPYEECARHTRTFRSNADLQRHIRSHRGERPYACPAPGCGKAYGQQNKMVNHVKQQHPSILPMIDIGRGRRRTAASAPVSRATSVARTTISAASTPGATSALLTPIRTPLAAPGAAAGPTRVVSSGSVSRPAPYMLPASMTSSTAAAHLALSQGLLHSSARRETSDENSLPSHMQQLRRDVFGVAPQPSLWG